MIAHSDIGDETKAKKSLRLVYHYDKMLSLGFTDKEPPVNNAGYAVVIDLAFAFAASVVL